MSLSYNCTQYIAKVMMSNKQRILVEGKHDKSHLKNLIKAMLGLDQKIAIEVDTAEQIQGDCKKTAKCNREKIVKIHSEIIKKPNINNIFFLCDREFNGFSIDKSIVEIPLITNKPLYFTSGHSFENFFLTEEIITNALSCHTFCEFKTEAVQIFKNNFSSIFEIISCITLTAKDLNLASYPIGNFFWDSFSSSNGDINLDIENWYDSAPDNKKMGFKTKYLAYYPVVCSTKTLTCMKISRGHTAIILLQRIFDYCLFLAIESQDKDLALKEAKNFANLSETQITSSLSHFWISAINSGKSDNDLYPVELINDFLKLQIA